MNDEQREQGERLMHAVERLIEDPEDIITRVESLKEREGLPPRELSVGRAGVVAQHLIERYSLRSATTGALTAVPAAAPGLGTIVAVGGTFVDLGLMLKHETELVLSLAYLHGFDIREPNERRLAFLMAASGSYEALTKGDNFLADIAAAEIEAIWHYTPRQVSKLLVSLLGKLALRSASKTLYRVIPLVGVAVSGTINKICTRHVGRQCNTLLIRRRRSMDDNPVAQEEDDVVDAWIKP